MRGKRGEESVGICEAERCYNLHLLKFKARQFLHHRQRASHVVFASVDRVTAVAAPLARSSASLTCEQTKKETDSVAAANRIVRNFVVESLTHDVMTHN